MPGARNQLSHKSRIPPNDNGESNTAPPIRTAGELFVDGGALELIRDSKGNPTLVLFDHGKCEVARRINTRHRSFEPLDIDPSILRAVTWPTKCLPYRSTHELFGEICQLVARVARVPEAIVTLIAFFVFATWLVDVLPLAPFLWVVVPPTASAEALSQLLLLLCRRALSVTDLSVPGLLSLPMELRPTIISEVATVTRHLIKVLRASNRRGTYVLARNKVSDVFCANVVFANQPLPDPASVGFPLEIALAPEREGVRPMNSEAEIVAAELRSKLLMYRLANHAKVMTPKFDVGDFTAPTRALAHILGACIVGDDHLQAQIVPVLRSHDRQIQVERTALLESIILEALLAASHDAKLRALSMTELSQSVNTILAGRGDSLPVSPEIVGWKLRSLGLARDLITGARRGLSLVEEMRAKIHNLATAYGVRTLRQGVIAGLCRYCDESVDLRAGSKLRK